ncbi:R-spondin-3, partial [Anabarilius grahami]
TQGCQGGCQTCSVYNGCLTCKPKLFIHLERDGMRQIGVCLASCPNGFYGTRSPDRNDCIKCGSECDSCFNRNFCLRCRAGSYLHKGKCMESCPDGLVPSDTKKECVPACPVDCDSCQNSDTCTRCVPGHFLLHGQCYHVCPDEFEPNNSMECIPTAHCEVGEWGEWSPCSHLGKTCGFKWGEETRTRKVLQNPSPMGSQCPQTSEKRDCYVKRRRSMPASALRTSINLPKREQLYWAFKARAFLLWDKPEPLIPAWLLPKAPGRQHASLHPTPPHPQGSLMKMCPTAPDIISYFNHLYLCVLNSSRLDDLGCQG